jgi:uncharacterized protein YndB with AHSA1/START domain
MTSTARQIAPVLSKFAPKESMMSVKKEASGRRSVQVEVEVSGSPEEVWQAVATGPGISCWFVPAEFEERDGKPVAVKLNFGPGMESRSDVTAWDPPRRFSAEAPGWAPGSPIITDEWTVEPHRGGKCLVRVTHSLVATTDDWDHQLQGTEAGWPGYFRILKLYLTHFRGQQSAVMQWIAPATGTEAEAWDTLTVALGLKGVAVGERWTAPQGMPASSGVVEHVTQSPCNALLRLDAPGPAIASLGTVNFGGTMVTLSFYLYGDQAGEIVARETPRWQAWIDERFPKPAEESKSA